MSTTKKIIIAIVVIIVIAGISFGAVWLGTNWDNITAQTDLYTYQDMVDYSDEKNQVLQDELENYKLLYETAIQKMTEAENDKNELTIQLAQVQDELQESLNQNEIDTAKILEHEATITELQNTISQLNKTISELQDDLVTLQNEYNDVVSENEDYVDEINSLNAQIVTLSNEVTELKAQLEAYEDMNLNDYYKIEFINTTNDLVVSSAYVRESTKLSSVPIIENTQDTWFYGWSTTEDSTSEFDFTNFTVDNNYTFYSILGETVPVTFQGNRLDVYWYGKNLTIKDILIINNKIDLDNENIEVVLDDNLTLDSSITNLKKLKYVPHGNDETEYMYYELDYSILIHNEGSDMSMPPSTRRIAIYAELENYELNYFSLSNIQFTISIDSLPGQTTIVTNFENKFNLDYYGTIPYIYTSTTATLGEYSFTFEFGIYAHYGNGCFIKVTSDNFTDYVDISNISFDIELSDSYVNYLDAEITDRDFSYTDFPVYEEV